MICPDFFGCSSKLTYSETRLLAESVGNGDCGDFANFDGDGAMVSSIDRIHRCASDWDVFARIALNHAFGDVLCAGAVPVQAMLSFEFGVDTDEADRTTCSASFARELARRGVQLGKCHSSQSEGVTAVTVAVVAARPTRINSSPREGRLYLSRPIGALKLLYLSELGFPVLINPLADVATVSEGGEFYDAAWSLVIDISGHGLLGAIASAAATHGLNFDLALSSAHVASADVLSHPVDCLQNAPSSYGVPLSGYDSRAVDLVTLKETAGPFIGFVEDDRDSDRIAIDAIPLGRYTVGSGRIGLAWTE